MSVSIEHALLSKVIQEGNFHTLEKAQINESFFVTPEGREVYLYLKQVFHDPQTTGQVPSMDLVRRNFPSVYLPPQVPDSVEILCTQLRQEKIRMDLLALSDRLREKAELDPVSALADLKSESIKLSSISEVGQDLSMSSAYNMLLENYETIQDAGGVIGIPYPWEAMNEATQGMQGGQFIIIYGRPKSMKSWIGINIGVNAYLQARRRVLFYTREMSPQMVAQRTAAALGRVDYNAFRHGRLQPELKMRTFQLLQELLDDERSAGEFGQHQPYFIITSDRSAASGGGGGGVGWLQAKIRELRPDLVIVDGMYLMKDDRSNQRTIDWKAISHISQDLKLTAQEFNIPIIGITQANRSADKSKGEDLTELGFSDSLGQDADAVFRVSKVEKVGEDGIKRTELWIKAPGLREGKFDGIVVKGEPASSFDYIRTIVDTEKEPEEYGSGGKGGGGGGGGGPAARSSFRRTAGSFQDPRIPAPR